MYMVELKIVIIQLLLESLPISSSGHIQFLRDILKKFYIQATHKKATQMALLQELLHIPTGLVLCLFLLVHMYDQSYTIFDLFMLVPVLISTTAMTGIMYVLTQLSPVELGLPTGFAITTGILLFLSDSQSWLHIFPRVYELPHISLVVAFLIGIGQGFALQPGISRLAITYSIGCMLGLVSQISFIYSLLAELCLVGAALLKLMCPVRHEHNERNVIRHYISYVTQLYPGVGKKSKGYGVCIYMLILVVLYASYALLELSWNLARQQAFHYFGYYMLALTIGSIWYYGPLILTKK